MAGSYRKLANGKYELTVHIGYGLDGKRIRKFKTVEASGPREAEKLLAELVSEYSSHDLAEKDKMTLKEYTAYWFSNYVEKELDTRTIQFYRDLSPRVNTALGHKKLRDLRATHLLAFYEMLEADGVRKDGKTGGLSTTRIKHYHAYLSSMFSKAVQWQILKENICKRVNPPKPTKEEKARQEEKEKNIYTIEQVQSLIDYLDQLIEWDLKYKAIVMVAIFCGFRRGEIMGLRWSDIEFENRTITIKRARKYTKASGIFYGPPKTAKSKRTVVMTSDLALLLKVYKVFWNGLRPGAGEKWLGGETDDLFITWDGLPMHPDTISTWFPKFVEGYGLPHLNFHGLRHLHISILVESGLDWGSIADDAGHINAQMIIEKYRHKVKNKNEEIAEAMEEALKRKDTSE